MDSVLIMRSYEVRQGVLITLSLSGTPNRQYDVA